MYYIFYLCISCIWFTFLLPYTHICVIFDCFPEVYLNISKCWHDSQFSTFHRPIDIKRIYLYHLDHCIIERFHMTSYVVLQHGGFYSNGNQYSFIQASFYIIVRNGFAMNFSIRGSSAWWSHARMVRVTALDYPGQSVQSDGHVGGQHDVSENALLVWISQHIDLW